MEDQARLIQFIAQLNRLTQERKIEWTAIPVTSVSSLTETKTFRAVHKDRILILSKVESALAKLYSMNNAKNSSESLITLEILNKNGASELKLNDVSGLSDLFSSVQYGSSGLAAFIDDVLAED